MRGSGAQVLQVVEEQQGSALTQERRQGLVRIMPRGFTHADYPGDCRHDKGGIAD